MFYVLEGGALIEGKGKIQNSLLQAETLLLRMNELQQLERWEDICQSAREACRKILEAYLLAIGSPIRDYRFLTTLGCCVRESEPDFDLFLPELERLDTYFRLREDFFEFYRRERKSLQLASRVAKSAITLTERLLAFVDEKLARDL